MFRRLNAESRDTRKDAVKDAPAGVKKPSGNGTRESDGPTVNSMDVLAFALFTLAIFALLGFAQRLIER